MFIVLVLAVWALTPLFRGIALVRHGARSDVVLRAVDGTLESVSFTTDDGVVLRGSYLYHDAARATIILVHGFKNTRGDMVEYGEFLYGAGYDILAYDSRGCGESAGTFGVGATEHRDIIGAVSYLKHVARGAHVALLGVSLGAGDGLIAAARDTRIEAVIADSSWADERVQLARMSSVQVGPVAVPLLPYEPFVVDAMVGGRLEDARPRDEIARIAPRPLLLIHSADDQNATTPLADGQALYAAAGEPKDIWVAPRGGHAGAMGANRDEYRRRVLAFLARAFG